MALLGTQIGRVKMALTKSPQIDPELKRIADQIVSESSSSGDKGFTGKRPKKEDLETVRAAVSSYAPKLPKDKADVLANQVLQVLEQRRGRVELAMKVVVSIFALSVGTFMMLHAPSGSDLSKWATGLIGTVIGYWLG